jgi:hypothetical protein
MKNKLLCFKILGNIKMSYVENHIKLNDQFNHLCEKDTRNEISFLEGSFEWAKRRGLVTFGLTIAIFPLAILAPLGDEKISLWVEKLGMQADHRRAKARLYDRMANKENLEPSLQKKYQQKSDKYRQKFQKRYQWIAECISQVKPNL